jgi:hypothetical protein
MSLVPTPPNIFSVVALDIPWTIDITSFWAMITPGDGRVAQNCWKFSGQGSLSTHLSRRHLTVAALTTATFAACSPMRAAADLTTAASSGLPLLGRFEPLRGAKSFIGTWELFTTESPSGMLTLFKNGDVELRKGGTSGAVIGVGTGAWKYIAPKGEETLVKLTFTMDVEGDDGGIFVYEGTLDSAAGPDRALEGSLFTAGRTLRRIGGFSARPLVVPTD